MLDGDRLLTTADSDVLRPQGPFSSHESPRAGGKDFLALH